MITQAKANASAVKTFEQSVSAARDYSARLDKGILCLEMLLDILLKAEKSLNDAISKATRSLRTLSTKIVKIEQRIARLTARLEQLERRLDSLEIKLEHTQENGDYVGESVVSEKISVVEDEISSIQDELPSLEERLDRANTVYSQLESHVDAMNGVAYSLAEKESTCRHLRDELETIQQKNLRQGASAAETLRRLQAIIEQYLRIKMEYEEMPIKTAYANNGSRNINTNININIHESTVVQMETVKEEITIKQETEDHSEESESMEPLLSEQESMEPLLSEQEIEENDEMPDDSRRIVLYDGKSFGGEYNSYSTRLKCTSVEDNPMLGHYEGERGESKFIPSNRTAEGIIIAEILEQYGLDGIVYRNAEPDFEVCAEAVVKIVGMTENRENYLSKDGTLVMGNFSQADMQLAEEWNRMKRDGHNDWTPRDVFNYRKANRLTWHEKCDTETMVLVRFEINLFFKHSGGCSECKIRDAVIDNGGDFDE